MTSRWIFGVVFVVLSCGKADPNIKPDTTASQDDLDYLCDGACLFGEHTACTCAPDDPCGWQNDGVCDADCINLGVVDTMFDDSEDCEGCGGECDMGLYSSCTCGTDDPCGWSGDGSCDKGCIDVIGSMFDDGEDCSGPCDGDCDAGWTECTCAPDDPCGWKGDGECDQGCLYFGVVEESFDDSEDCPGPCTGECDLGHSACTCAPDDPCGWQNDGFCDRVCEIYGLVDEMFDDSADCEGPCDGECDMRVYTPCTCASDDPCDWQQDTYCDMECLNAEGVSEMFDDSKDCS